MNSPSESSTKLRKATHSAGETKARAQAEKKRQPKAIVKGGANKTKPMLASGAKKLRHQPAKKAPKAIVKG
jgi:hypothetical protein